MTDARPDDGTLQDSMMDGSASSHRAIDHPPLEYTDLDDGLRQLPRYSRSLLKIRIPVVVTLASSKQPVRKIVDLGPGAIIQFDKSCDETLTVEVGDRCVAKGEAVKVGDKFGLRITSIVMPAERFTPIARPSNSRG